MAPRSCLQMAAAVASAAHAFKEIEASVILDHINNGLQVPEAERHRLAAKLHLYRAAPPESSRSKRALRISAGRLGNLR